MTTFRKTLRRLAVEQDAAERLRLSDVLASQLEVTFDHQGDLNQVALSDTEEVLLGKIDGLQKDVGDNNLLISAFIERFPAQLDAFQQGLRAAVAEETARGLGKLSQEIEALHQGQARISAEIKDVDARHGGQWEQAMTLIAESQADRRSIHEELAALKAQLTTYMAGSKRAEVEDIRREIERLKQARGDASG
jgi:hypothetical protein